VKTTEKILGMIDDSKKNMKEREQEIKKNSKRDRLIFVVLILIWLFVILYSNFFRPGSVDTDRLQSI
jgi:uncharacterized membrane protein YobD (UPF0266 family)